MDSSSTIQPSSPHVSSPRRPDKHAAPNLDEASNADETLSHSGSSRGRAAVLKSLYGPVAGSLHSVEQLLQSELQSQIESLAPLLRHGTQLGGKRMRPAMLLLAAQACQEVSATTEQVALAAVIEMVHTATLIHDDVLDDATTRRHVPTINAKWDNHTSILLGDYLFAQSFRLAATHSSAKSCALIGEAARLVCEGELRQVLRRDFLDLDEESYIEIVRGKTAELCRIACRLGAESSGATEETIQCLSGFGDAVGIAFQIADDYLDLWGDDNQVGKSLGTDVQQGKMTLPLIRLLQTANDSERESIASVLTGPADERVERIRPWLQESDAREYTEAVARHYRQTAIDHLGLLPASDAKDSLIQIAEFTVNRPF